MHAQLEDKRKKTERYEKNRELTRKDKKTFKYKER